VKILVTGSTGFVGSEVVRVAHGRGHEIVALVRPAATTDHIPPGVHIARGDLRSPQALGEALQGVDAAVHLAATKEGDFHHQFATTVVGTENLLATMQEAGVSNLVAVSTFAVYGHGALRPGTTVDEQSPILQDATAVGDYAETKLVQERLYRRFGWPDDKASERSTNRCVILRPGMVYGPHELWHAMLGAEFGRWHVRIGTKAVLPLTYVRNCAEAIVLASEKLVEPAGAVHGQVINIVDDDLPTQTEYVRAVAAETAVPSTVTVPWRAVRLGADAVALANRHLFDDRLRLPGIAISARVDARFKPLHYTNRRAKELLGWSPKYTLTEAIDQSVSIQDNNSAGEQS